MKIIVAVSKNWGIGNKNSLLFSLKEDMKFFRENTTGATVVMGGNTFKSLPGPRPLKNRKNIVLSKSDLGYDGEDLIRVNSLNELAEVLKKEKNEVFIIGGASFYRTMLPYCSEALITKVDSIVSADAFFEDLDKQENWKCVNLSDIIEDCGHKIRFTTYKNLAVKEFMG